MGELMTALNEKLQKIEWPARKRAPSEPHTAPYLTSTGLSISLSFNQGNFFFFFFQKRVIYRFHHILD